MKKPARFLLMIVSVFMSCSAYNSYPEINCDAAELRVINTGMDTIPYAIGSGIVNGTLAPGDSISHFLGPVHINAEEQSTWEVDFVTPHKTYTVEVNECLERLLVHEP